jgi:hypothetical protein
VQAINYTAPKTCARFMLDESFIRLIWGPVGSGKTTACIFELFRRAAAQAPSYDGYRYTRFAICRQTLQQLKQTVLKDLLAWLPGIALWRVSESTVHVELGDIKSEWILLPMEDPDDRRRLLSSQLTGAWISECIEIDSGLVADIAGRCGRYPTAAMGGCTWKGVLMDTNPPEEGSSWWDLMENVRAGWAIFRQPGGLDPLAENLPYLDQTAETLKLSPADPVRIAQGRKYYERLSTQSPAYVERYVHARYGIDPSGRAVFGAIFFPKSPVGTPWHVTRGLVPVPGATLILGQDFGRDPCALLGQLDQAGRLLILQEFICRHMGLQVAYEQHIIPGLRDPRYIGLPVVVIGDPAGVAKDTIFETTSIDFIKGKGFHCFPAPTNDIDPRIRAVESWLLGSRMGGAAVLIDEEKCPTFISALKMGYRFENVKSSQTTVQSETKPKPLKNEYSHIADAGQYLCQAAQGGYIGYIHSRIVPRALAGNTRAPQFSHRAWT